jgi:hypothetical protein
VLCKTPVGCFDFRPFSGKFVFGRFGTPLERAQGEFGVKNPTNPTNTKLLTQKNSARGVQTKRKKDGAKKASRKPDQKRSTDLICFCGVFTRLSLRNQKKTAKEEKNEGKKHFRAISSLVFFFLPRRVQKHTQK